MSCLDQFASRGVCEKGYRGAVSTCCPITKTADNLRTTTGFVLSRAARLARSNALATSNDANCGTIGAAHLVLCCWLLAGVIMLLAGVIIATAIYSSQMAARCPN